jgi:hypothetical protein
MTAEQLFAREKDPGAGVLRITAGGTTVELDLQP